VSRRRFTRGLAAERTALAWRRSMAGLVGMALLLGRDALTRWPPLAAALATVAVSALVVVAVGAGQRRAWTLRQPKPEPLPLGGLALLTATVLATAILGGLLLVSTAE
jgi:hypothetical protein